MKLSSLPLTRILPICLLLCLGCPVWAGAGADVGLSVLEQQTLGKKFDNQPEEERVVRLEHALNQPVNPHASISYRLSQLFAAQEANVSQKNHQLAVDAYNTAIEMATQHKTNEAIEQYQNALSLDPGLVQAYNNLANLLLQEHRYEETVEVYKHGLDIKPTESLLHRNLGVLYEKLGKIPDAVDEYKAYLQLSTQPDPPIKAIVDNYDKFHKAGMNTPDYLKAVTHATSGQPLLWPTNTNPIKVYVAINKPDELFVPELLRQAMGIWTNASKGRLRFEMTRSLEQANIHVILKEGPLIDPKADIGHTEYRMPERQLFQHRMDFVTITLNTGLDDPENPLPMENRREQIYRMALHELGHAVGIWGHSPDPGDIMFTHPIADRLSSRDINTIRKLYGL